jgi:regulator of protease activity HflC (stomatin/prohibitin superfamily)
MSLFISTKFTVHPGVNTVEYVDGVCTRVLKPGRHAKRSRAEYRAVSVRERLHLVAPQEVLTSDGVTVRVTASVRSLVADPQRFLEAADDPFALVYLAVQVALREALVEVDAESVVRAARSALGDSVTLAARAVGVRVGLDVLEVVVKDVILPPELRSAYAELVTARTRGLAQLEAARSETAALRSLANGAKLLDEHPALARLRLVQALPYGSKLELSLVDSPADAPAE